MPKQSTPALAVQSDFWLTAGGESLGGHGRIELLQRIHETGSIRQAAVAMGMSYRAAWGAVQTMERRLEQPLVLRAAGGHGGGGARLSEEGQRLVKAYRSLQTAHARQVAQLDRKLRQLWG